jgi:hypothetical protein
MSHVWQTREDKMDDEEPVSEEDPKTEKGE